MRFLEGSASPASTPAKWSASAVALLSRSCLRAKTSCHCPFLYLLRQVKALSRDKHQFSSTGVVLCTSIYQIPIWGKKKKKLFIYLFIQMFFSVSEWKWGQHGEEFRRQNWSLSDVTVPQNASVGQGNQAVQLASLSPRHIWAASSNLGCHCLSVSCLLMQGRRVVETLSVLKVCYSTLKGLFGNEDGASRCCLITVAAELFHLSGSVEGALNTLRGSDSWSWSMFI